MTSIDLQSHARAGTPVRALGHNRERASTGYLGSDAGLPEAANDAVA